MIEYAHAQKFGFMMTDLRAARWVIERISCEDDALVLEGFLGLHRFILKRIGKKRPDPFQRVDRSHLLRVVRGWMELYLAALREMRLLWPRAEGTADLLAEGINWSLVFGISFDGLMGIDFASRYAEFWAERSVSDPSVFTTHEARHRLIGSPIYRLIDSLTREDRLLVVDDYSNSITAFDIWSLLCRRSPEPGQVRELFDESGWHTIRLCQHAARSLSHAARKRLED